MRPLSVPAEEGCEKKERKRERDDLKHCEEMLMLHQWHHLPLAVIAVSLSFSLSLSFMESCERLVEGRQAGTAAKWLSALGFTSSPFFLLFLQLL